MERFTTHVKPNQARERDQLKSKIWEYVKSRPEVGDTLEGIIRWWLPQQELVIVAHKIETAVEALVKQNYLVAEPLPDGQTHYRVHPERKAELLRRGKPEKRHNAQG